MEAVYPVIIQTIELIIGLCDFWINFVLSKLQLMIILRTNIAKPESE